VLVEQVESGFLNTSTDDIIKFIQKIPADGTFTPLTFAILDERTIRDKTVAIHHYVVEWPEMPEDADIDEWLDENAEKTIKSWKEWRVPFASAAYVAMKLDDSLWEQVQQWGIADKKHDFIDEDGVLQLPTLSIKAFDMLDEDGWPAGMFG
jgi:hypothetical protein